MKRQKIFFTSDLHFGHENVLSKIGEKWASRVGKNRGG